MNLTEALAGLGSTKEEVSKVLRDKRIMGYPRSATQCPIANYLKSCGFPYVTVDGSLAKVYEGFGYDHGVKEVATMPPHVMNWVLEFDLGHHSQFNF